MHVLQRHIHTGDTIRPGLNGITVTITNSSDGSAATCYEDRAGTTSTSNSFAVQNGFFRVYVPNGRYDITATDGVSTKVERDVELGVWETGEIFTWSSTKKAAGSLVALENPYNAIFELGEQSAGFGLMGDVDLSSEHEKLYVEFSFWDVFDHPTNEDNWPTFTLPSNSNGFGLLSNPPGGSYNALDGDDTNWIDGSEPDITCCIRNTCRSYFDGKLLAPGRPSPTDVKGYTSSYGTFRTEKTRAVVMMAVNFPTAQVWMGVDGSWVGGGDPALGTNPLLSPDGNSINGQTYNGSGWTDQNWFPFVEFRHDTAIDAKVRARIFGSSAHPFNYPIPAGFNGT